MGLLRIRSIARHWAEPGLSLAGGGGFVGAYDAIPNIAAAYGMRRLLSSYTGNLLRLRRASDNAESDFGYVANGDLDTTAIATFLSATTGQIVTWYDQSGNANNAVQATAANQPLYVASGQNSKPTARWDGTNDALIVAHTADLDFAKGEPFSISLIASRSGTTSDILISKRATSSFVDGWDAGVDSASTTPHARRIQATGGNDTARDLGPAWAGSFAVLSVMFRATEAEVYVNGVTNGATAVDFNSDNTTNIYIGDLANGVAPFAGDMAEIIIASAAWGTSDREAAETAANAYWSLY